MVDYSEEEYKAAFRKASNSVDEDLTEWADLEISDEEHEKKWKEAGETLHKEALAIIARQKKPPLKAHGLIKDIADWIVSTALYPQPNLAIAAALTFMGFLKGHCYRTTTDLRSNLLTLSIAPSASGKEHPQQCLIRLMNAIGMRKHLLGDPASGSGFLTGLRESDARGLWVIDEMGCYVANAMNENSGSYQREIIDYVLKSYSRANSTLTSKQYADSKAHPRIDIENPHFCCLGSTVRQKMVDACKSSSIIDGFLNRWIIFEGEPHPDECDIDFNESIPEELIDVIKNHPIPKKDSYGVPIVETLAYTPEAAEIMKDFRASIRLKIKKEKYPYDALYGRSSAHVAKIAMIVSDNQFIGVHDVNFAIAVVEQSNINIMKFASKISDNIYERDFIRVRDIIEEAGVIKKNILTRRTQFLTGGEKRRAEIIAALLDGDIIEEQPDDSRTKKSVKYAFIG